MCMDETTLKDNHFASAFSTFDAYVLILVLFCLIGRLNGSDLQYGSAGRRRSWIDRVRRNAEWTHQNNAAVVIALDLRSRCSGSELILTFIFMAHVYSNIK